jgi:hypothetical protein
VSLAIDERSDSSAVIADISTGRAFVLLRRRGSSVFRYYNAHSDTLWLRAWSSHVTLPIALALVADRDTLVLPVSVAR